MDCLNKGTIGFLTRYLTFQEKATSTAIEAAVIIAVKALISVIVLSIRE